MEKLKNTRRLTIMINVKLTRRNKAEAPYCPNCLNLLESADNVGGWLSSKQYYCPKCNYRGSFFVVKDEEEEEESTTSNDNDIDIEEH